METIVETVNIVVVEVVIVVVMVVEEGRGVRCGWRQRQEVGGG